MILTLTPSAAYCANICPTDSTDISEDELAIILEDLRAYKRLKDKSAEQKQIIDSLLTIVQRYEREDIIDSVLYLNCENELARTERELNKAKLGNGAMKAAIIVMGVAILTEGAAIAMLVLIE